MSLQPFGPGLWTAGGSITEVAGFRYPTLTAIIRLADGGLFVWSPIQLTPALRAEVDALGEVRHLVAPNSLHHLFLPDWKQAYPGATLYAAPGLRARRPDIAFDADLDATPPAAWAGQIDQVPVLGNRITTEVVFFHRASGAAIFTDLIQHFAPGWFSGWRAIVARLDLMVAPEPSVPRKFRVAFTDRPAARASLAAIRAWPVNKVLMAHGTPIEHDAAAFLGRAFSWLGR
jgi:hypothetical protein